MFLGQVRDGKITAKDRVAQWALDAAVKAMTAIAEGEDPYAALGLAKVKRVRRSREQDVYERDLTARPLLQPWGAPN